MEAGPFNGDIKRLHPGRPVLVLSMYPEELHATRVLKAGGAGYMNKDSAGEELIAAIRKIRKGGRYVSAALADRLCQELAVFCDAGDHRVAQHCLRRRTAGARATAICRFWTFSLGCVVGVVALFGLALFATLRSL